jgi:hypothetical protein
MAVVLKGYEVFETVDEYGRRGKTIGYYTDKNSAEIAGKGRGWFGSDAPVHDVWLYDVDGSEIYLLAKRQPITVNEDLIRLEQETKRRAKAKILNSLTDSEMRSIGLDPDTLAKL